MKKQLRKTVLILALPLVGSAVVLGDTVRIRMLEASGHAAFSERASLHQDVDGLERTLRAHYIRLDSQNRLTGRISAINDAGAAAGVSELDVALVQNSSVVARTVTGADGSFATSPLSKGNYTFCVSGPDGFLAYGVHVVEPRTGTDGNDNSLPLPSSDGPARSGEDSAIPPIGEAPQGSTTGIQLSVNIQPAAATLQAEQLQLTAAVIPPEFKALRRIMSEYVPAGISPPSASGADGRINVEKSLVVGGFEVGLTAEGSLEGRISQVADERDQPIRLQEMNAFLLKDDEIYSRVIVEADGNFVFRDIEPGVYGFVAAGRDGFAALSFRAVLSPAPAEGGDRNAAWTQAPAPRDLQVAICPPEDLPWLRDRIEQLNRDGGFAQFDPGFPPMDGGMPFGGDGFGFGGGGGGFGFGGFAELGLAAWLTYEIIDSIDDDDHLVIPPPVSPSTLD